MRNLILLLVLSFSHQMTFSQKVNIIPKPLSVVEKNGDYKITPKTTIVAENSEAQKTATFLNDYLSSYYGFKLPIKKSGNAGIIIKTGAGSNKEGYVLDVDNNAVVITGNSVAGSFYGMQTLIQLLPVEKSNSLSIAAVTVKDEPLLSYRGLHLDVSRHFFPVSYLKKYIDYIALHKMNYFHWHLTDDQGWRIEIKKYPKLTSVGGWRNGTIVGNFPGKLNESKRYGGFYTQKEVKEVVAYAAERYITVIPEIEMPGHASAAIAAYPYLSCFPNESTKYPAKTPWYGTEKGKQVQQTWGVFDDVFCAGKETTFEFLQNVMDEVLPLFPSKYVHIGGDECPKENWKRCPNCQKRMTGLNLKNEHELQSYFVQRMEKYLNTKGKTIIGWDEILEGGLAPNAIVMSWRGEKGGIEAAKLKHQVIMTPTDYAYFDYQQAKHDDSVTISNNKGFLPINKIYNWNVVPQSLNKEDQQYILGGQANLWTEYVKNSKKVEYMIFPRVAALSEALWTPVSNREWDGFQNRLKVQKQRYSLWGVNYFNK